MLHLGDFYLFFKREFNFKGRSLLKLMAKVGESLILLLSFNLYMEVSIFFSK